MADYLPLAEQLNILFEVVTKPDGGHYTLKNVSKASGVSLPTLSQLRNAKIVNPQLNTLRAICGFFDVPLRYFDTRTREECLAIIAEGRQSVETDTGDHIATMAASLSPEGQRDLLAVIQWARAAEQQMEQDDSLPPMPRINRDED